MQTDSLFLPPSKPQSTTGPQSHCYFHWFICKWLSVDGNKHNSTGRGWKHAYSKKWMLSAPRKREWGCCFTEIFFLQRHIKPSGFLKASFSCLTAMVVASTLAVAMEPYLFQHCGVLLQSPKDIFVATLNWQWNWCFVQLPCSLWETELGYCKSISTVIVCIWTHLLVTARRQCSKWTSYGELTHCNTSLSTKGISYVDLCVNWL